MQSRANVVYAVYYRDYQNRKHLYFCPSKNDVHVMEINYDIEKVQSVDASFVDSFLVKG